MPKTCTKCGETEGEPVAHAWVEATCTQAKHCTLCGKTDGAPLEHTLTEANYQDAATCTVCGTVVGEPLTAYFEEYGIECNVTAWTQYEYKNPAPENPNKIVTGQYCFFGEDGLPADGTLEELEGYEWKRVWIESLVPESEMQYGGLTWASFLCDYYKEMTEDGQNLDHGEYATYSVNWQGIEYSECLARLKLVQNVRHVFDERMNTEVWSYITEWAVRVPVGYDGLVVGVYQMTPEKQDWWDNHPEEICARTIFDDESLVYRLK